MASFPIVTEGTTLAYISKPVLFVNLFTVSPLETYREARNQACYRNSTGQRESSPKPKTFYVDIPERSERHYATRNRSPFAKLPGRWSEKEWWIRT